MKQARYIIKDEHIQKNPSRTRHSKNEEREREKLAQSDLFFSSSTVRLV